MNPVSGNPGPGPDASGRLEVEAEFLRRALGAGERGDPATVHVVPDALAQDFPFPLPELPGLNVYGSVRSVAPRWTFFGSDPSESPEFRWWRTFFDVELTAPEVVRTFRAHLSPRGWRTAELGLARAVLAADRGHWHAVCPEQRLELHLNARQAARAAQVWLSVTEVDEDHALRLQGLEPRPPYLPDFDLALPTLVMPPGVEVQFGHGSSYEEITVLRGLPLPEAFQILLGQLTAQGAELRFQLLEEGEAEAFLRWQGLPLLLSLRRQGDALRLALRLLREDR